MGSKKPDCWLTLGGAAIAFLSASVLYPADRDPGPLLAILDTGVSRARFSPEIGDALWKRIEKPELPFEDLTGHGSQLVRLAASECAVCRFLPIRLAADAGQIRAKDYTRGIEEAIRRSASAIVIPSASRDCGRGVEAQALRSAVALAAKKKTPIIAAAGVGIPNPYRPSRLSDLCPQKFPTVWVIGAGAATAQQDRTLLSLQNQGEELRFRVIAEHSSGAATRFASWLVRQKQKGLSVTEALRQLQVEKPRGSLLTLEE